MTEVETFLKTFGISDDEAIRALISVFTPCSPGVVRQGWRRSTEYQDAPETSEIWQLMARADFRCELCASQYRITIDHKDRDKTNNSISNLRILCTSCNRGLNSKGTVTPNVGLAIYRAAMDLFSELGRFPTNAEISKHTSIPPAKFGTTLYLLRFLQARLATITPVRHCRPQTSRSYGIDKGASSNNPEVNT